MNESLKAPLTVVGRVMLATIFLMSALGNKIPNFSGTVDYMSGNDVPAPSIMLVGAIVFLLAGGISLVLGFKARIGASLLVVFLILATYYFHDFWTHAPDSQEFQMQMIQFMKNLGLMGAMLMIVANGPGPGSLDNCKSSKSEGDTQ
ncbi:DoxX family protein [Crateriforma spongiae]|uniref:DoxX family protein n=1 Tax=Crateriforma spongiae TaxID=2724528 RepID=UPI0014485C92|nr:DoxX family protein [Crateriforma spongiae]